MKRKNDGIRKVATKNRTVLAILDGMDREMHPVKTGFLMFRPHRGGLAESVAGRRTFESKNLLVSHVVKEFGVDDHRRVKLQGRGTGVYEGLDPRIGWAWTGFVTIDGRCVGMWTDEWDKEVLLSYLDEHGIK